MSDGNTGRGNSVGTTLGDKLKGAWYTVEGAGDCIRGSAMDFVDSATGTGGHHTETDVGAQKTRAGIAEVKGSAYADNTSTSAAPTGQATATSTAPPPLPARGETGANSASNPTGPGTP
ncbi:hypothetical protein AcV5_002993 [Taiwanofungus camphoratus]|nr:hypothetical protein AcV5_002993 [Antrodia cinnamomea]